MNLEPQKFYIGLVDFFSIMMPGALLAYLGKDYMATMILGQAEFLLNSTEAWMVFLFASYLLGHFAFLIGTALDDWVYDPLRKCTTLGQVRRLADSKNLSNGFLRKIAASNLFFGKKADLAVIKAERLKADALRVISAEDAINAYQWCKVRLSREHPDGLTEVQRFEASSKFFRSFFVVLVPLFVTFTVFTTLRGSQQWWLPALISAILLLLSIWRYIDQRFKATQHAYWFVLMLESLKDPSGSAISPIEREDVLTHAGGVVLRKQGGSVEYLLVNAKKDRTQWVLPKGHIEQGEKPQETAVREVREETGYWARVLQPIEDLPFQDKHEPIMVRFYLMEMMIDKNKKKNERLLSEENREYQWLTLPEATEMASFNETKSLLVKADALFQKSDNKEK